MANTPEDLNMTPSRPYLLRAIYDWLVDNELTPHITVNALQAGVRVPSQFVQNGQIVLNIAPHSVGQLQLDNDAVSFHARFQGAPHQVYVPIAAVVAIYARENGAGTVFEHEAAYDEQEEAIHDLSGVAEEHPLEPNPEVEPGEEQPTSASQPTRPSLRVVK